MIKACHVCQMTSIPPREPPVVMTKLPNGPWRELAMDITGPFEDSYYLLVVPDYYSCFPLVEILKSVTSQSIINQLRKWFAIFGLPSVIKTGNASNFVKNLRISQIKMALNTLVLCLIGLPKQSRGNFKQINLRSTGI